VTITGVHDGKPIIRISFGLCDRIAICHMTMDAIVSIDTVVVADVDIVYRAL
jgi:hypothetical protein